MRNYRESRWSVALFALLILGGAAAFFLFLMQPTRIAARRGSPPPSLPAFEGSDVSLVFTPEGLTEGVDVPALVGVSGWTVIMEDNFESGLDTSVWLNVDGDGSVNGEYKWGTREVTNPLAGGQRSVWGIGGGQDGQSLDPADDGYPHNVDSWLIHGPVDMSAAKDAELSFNYMYDAHVGDTFSVLVSEDLNIWQGKQTDNGGTATWLGRNFALSEFAGKSNVYIAFQFQSDDNGNSKKVGPFVDDVVLRLDMGNVQYLPQIISMPSPTPTVVAPTPVPTPTPPPGGGDYLDEFTEDIFGWEARRWNTNAFGKLGYRHKDDTDGGRQGFLEMELVAENGFFIVSPLIESKEPPYNIEFFAKLKDPQDRQMYGIMFAADWNGEACPTFPTSANCFTSYYELRVQYRKFDGKEFQEVKLKLIESHDENGEPVGPLLIDWTKGGNVGPDDWAEIDVNVSENGKITISFNDKFIAQINDTTLLDQRYFGMQLITKEEPNARVKYDYLKID